MRMNKIPRGVQNPIEGGPSNFNIVAEPVELGSGIQDTRINHMQPPAEADWFNAVEQRNPDPRYAPSYIHGNPPPARAKVKVDVEHIVDGMVVGAFMQKDGAHLEVVSLDGSNMKFALFCEDTPLVRLGLKVRVSEKTKHDLETGDILETEILVEDIDD